MTPWNQSGPREEEWVECGSSDMGEEEPQHRWFQELSPVTDVRAHEEEAERARLPWRRKVVQWELPLVATER